MHDLSVMHATEHYRRHGTARRTMTLAPLTPSQDVTRYQAKLMPPPIFDLERRDEPPSTRALLIRTLVFAAMVGTILLIQRIGVWLGP